MYDALMAKLGSGILPPTIAYRRFVIFFRIGCATTILLCTKPMDVYLDTYDDTNALGKHTFQ